jgi:RimJ/RimL family protein N-acetyltransferase
VRRGRLCRRSRAPHRGREKRTHHDPSQQRNDGYGVIAKLRDDRPHQDENITEPLLPETANCRECRAKDKARSGAAWTWPEPLISALRKMKLRGRQRQAERHVARGPRHGAQRRWGDHGSARSDVFRLVRCEDLTVSEIHTPRLRLIPGTVELFDAELRQPARLARLLGVAEVGEWPPDGSDYDRDAVELFRSQLITDPNLEGWNSYYVCYTDALVGNGGYFGPPADGVTEIGYAVCRPWRCWGIASEVVGALIDRASALGLKRLVARTRPENVASITVLARNGFHEEISDQNDQLLFVRSLAEPAPSG